jgi:hypothetical protein
MQVPLDFWNISLWIAVTSIVLLITAQLISAYDGPSMLLIDQRKLKIVALTMGILFLATAAVRIYGIVASG